MLDISRAHYSEGGERQIKIRCDGCGVLSPGAGSQARAEVGARALGWIVTSDVDQCPTCRPDAPKLLEGQVTASIPKAPLSSPEFILISRLEYFANRITDGTSPRAAVINSRSSGHRHMLTDFASGFGYDLTKLTSCIEDLETRGAAMPSNLLSGGKSREWFEVLFILLKMDDDVP